MRKTLWVFCAASVVVAGAFSFADTMIKLPEPALKSQVSVEEAIYSRRSTRNYKKATLNQNEVAQILWAAGGMTCDGVTGATRAYPSAGACHPLEIYLLVSDVEGISPGIYRYLWDKHSLALQESGDKSAGLSAACHNQPAVKNAPASIIFTSVYSRTTGRYGTRGERYAHMDVGHAGQNVHLQAESLGLGTVIVGAFKDDEVKKALNLPDEEAPLYIMPIGRKP